MIESVVKARATTRFSRWSLIRDMELPLYWPESVLMQSWTNRYEVTIHNSEDFKQSLWSQIRLSGAWLLMPRHIVSFQRERKLLT